MFTADPTVGHASGPGPTFLGGVPVYAAEGECVPRDRVRAHAPPHASCRRGSLRRRACDAKGGGGSHERDTPVRLFLMSEIPLYFVFYERDTPVGRD